MDFLNGTSEKSDLLEHKLAIELLYRISLSLNKNMEKENIQEQKYKETSKEHE